MFIYLALNEYLNFHNHPSIYIGTHTSKVMLKVLQARLQQYVNRELPDVDVQLLANSHSVLTAFCPTGTLQEVCLLS